MTKAELEGEVRRLLSLIEALPCTCAYDGGYILLARCERCRELLRQGRVLAA